MSEWVFVYMVLYLAFFISVELWKRKRHLQAEQTRKFVHVGSSVLAITMPFVLEKQEVILLAFLFVLLLATTKYFRLFSSVQGVKRKTVGEFTFALSAVISAWLFLPDQKMAFITGFMILGLSDTAAQLVGKAMPLRTFRIFGQQKSLGGSLAFALMTSVIWLLAASYLTLEMEPSRLILGCIALTMLEFSQVFGMDNLFIPACAGIIWQWSQVSA